MIDFIILRDEDTIIVYDNTVPVQLEPDEDIYKLELIWLQIISI